MTTISPNIRRITLVHSEGGGGLSQILERLDEVEETFTVSSTGNLTLNPNGGYLYTPSAIEITTAGQGIILKSPDGTRYKLTVANGGALSIAAT